jgi:hypothetical protein
LQACVESVTVGSFAAIADPTTKCGRLHVLADGAVAPDGVADLPLQYISSCDRALVAAGKATLQDEGDLLHCRVEGEFLVSYRTAKGWTGISKDLLTDLLGQGTDVVVRGVPSQAAAQLLLLCPGLVVLDIGEG